MEAVKSPGEGQDISVAPTSKDHLDTSGDSGAAPSTGAQRTNDESSQTDGIPGSAKIAVAPTGIGMRYRGADERWKTVDLAEFEILQPANEKHKYVLQMTDDDCHRMCEIWSPYLVQVLRTQVPFTRDVQSSSFQHLVMSYPYSTLYFFLPQLQEYVRDDKSPNAKPQDFDVLLNWYTKNVQPKHEAIRYDLRDGMAEFNDLWAVFQPGLLLYCRDAFDHPVLFCLESYTYRDPEGMDIMDPSEIGTHFGRRYALSDYDDRKSSKFTRLCISAWRMQWDHSKRTFYRQYLTFTIPRYLGSKKIMNLPFYPLKFYCDGDEKKIESLLASLEVRGRKWKGMVRESAQCFYYRGRALKLKPYRDAGQYHKMRPTFVHFDDRVMVETYRSVTIDEYRPSDALPPTFRDIAIYPNEDHQEHAVPAAVNNDEYLEFDRHPPDKSFTTLQAQLSPASLTFVGIADTTWYLGSFEVFADVDWNRGSFNSLVMDPTSKKLLRDLVSDHIQNQSKMQGDFIHGKGTGLVVVLYGPSGVGKTMTAESVAEYCRKPLLPVKVGELVAFGSVVDRLTELFDMAANWDAILLLDEADVVMEQRSYEDLERNGIVSVFLRMLEYFKGIMFLTTNRLETVDPAFQSRVHIALPYKSLTPDYRRKIWKKFLSRMNEDEATGREELLGHIDRMGNWDLNGRQIRNILSIARSTAFSRGLTVRYKDVQHVAEDTLQFQAALKASAHEMKSNLGSVAGHAWPRQGQSTQGRITLGRGKDNDDDDDDKLDDDWDS